MSKCIACNKPVRWFHKHGYNSSWHKVCTIAYEMGYTTAINFADGENFMAGYPKIMDLYWVRVLNVKKLK